ncbi:MAG: hypothetical protein HRU15_17930 [Planctomycetes bacterium]|nr:hypothetical protein [Planctomycetota bacterium]
MLIYFFAPQPAPLHHSGNIQNHARATSQYKNKHITWIGFPRPPYFITDGPQAGNGYADNMQKIWEAELSDYSHSYLVMNSKRFLELIKRPGNYAIAAIGKFPANENLLNFSKPTYALPQPRIVMRIDTWHTLGKPELLSMHQLLKNNSLTFGTIVGYQMFPIDISQYQNQQNIYSTSSSSPMETLMKMMRKKRVDWIIEHPVFLKWEDQQSNHADKHTQFVTIPIKEAKKDNIYARFAASRGIWGEELCRRINASLQKKRILRIRSFVHKWFFDQSSREEYTHINQEYFGF